jgi:LmbE family N-acetylglucosaminyl deacetylase
MKAMAMVAHPDDCVIFAYSYIHNHPEYSWTVCYLTYTAESDRGKEFVEFWQKRNVATKFLGYADQWNHEQNCPGTIDDVSATRHIQQAILDQDLVLTHNAQGEYGHPHHVMINRATAQHPHRITFANFGQGNARYSVESGAYDLNEFPLHRDIVEQFHKHTHVNEYTV